MSCWTCKRCGQKWCDLDECPMCGEFAEAEYHDWENPHLHEMIGNQEREYYERKTS